MDINKILNNVTSDSPQITDDFSINYIKFSNKYQNNIKKGIVKKYSELYDKQNIKIKYKKILGEYAFVVYFKVETIDVNNNFIQTGVIIAIYTNKESVIFSSFPKEQIYDRYDITKKNYLQQLENNIESSILILRLKGIVMDQNIVKKSKNFICITLPFIGMNVYSYRYKNAITKKEFQILIDKITKLFNYYENKYTL